MTREWSILWEHRADLLVGLANTAELTILAGVGALFFGALVSFVLVSPVRTVALGARGFVDLMRCIPFLLFAYLIYYGLPSFGIRLDGWTAGLLALLLYNTAYMGEALRAGRLNVARESIEAGRAFGFRGFSLFRRLILPPVLLATTPIVGNQLIQIIKDSSFLAIIAVPELTHEANTIQSNYYIPFSTFAVTVLLYWGLSLAIEAGVGVVRLRAEARL